MTTWTAKQNNTIPDHIKYIIDQAKRQLLVERIWLYGSRARGDARSNSDFDLAFLLSSNDNWSSFCIDVKENVPSFYEYDLVDFDKCDQALRNSILTEGVIIYENKN